MPEREVQSVEVVLGGLDLPAVEDAIAETEEDVLDLTADVRDRVQMPTRGCRARQGRVDDVLPEAPVELVALEASLPARRTRSRAAPGRRSAPCLCRGRGPAGAPASDRSCAPGSGRAPRPGPRSSRRPQSRLTPRFQAGPRPSGRAYHRLMSVSRLRLAPAGETMFPPRAPFLQSKVEEPPGSPTPPPHAHRPKVGL